MSPVREVSFDLERFGWTEDERLEVVGRWTGLRGRRVGRPVLTVAGRRLPALPGGQFAAADEPWRAVFVYDGDPADVTGAELEIGRSLVVDLPAPRRRRRRPPDAAPPADVAEVETLRSELAAARAEAEALRSRADDESELAGLRLAHGSLRAAHEQLEDEVEELRGARDERDRLAGELEQLRALGVDEERVRADLGEVIRELQDRAAEADAARERLTGELRAAREEVAQLRAGVEQREAALGEARADAERRLETERATTTEVHSRLATAREEAHKTIAAEAEETERLRAELETARADAERLLAAERAEVARLREELVSRDDDVSDESSRRMLERIARDLDRERTTTRHLRRELDTVRARTAQQRRTVAAATANGTATLEEPLDRAVRTPEGTQRRVEAARAASARRVPQVPPSPLGLWAVRIGAAVLVAVLGIALVLLLSAIT